jgi:chorismate mutase/prephenate dehydratase
MAVSRAYQYRMQSGLKVAYSGVEGAFAHIAAGRIFPEGNRVSYSDFKAAYDSVVSGESDVAVLPIENSYAGEVGQTIDIIFSGNLFINGIYELEIHQNLLGVEDASIDDIKKVISHPPALGQCASFIERHALEMQDAVNTAVAAKKVAEMGDKTVAAIGSIEAAQQFELQVISERINDSGTNATRFAIFSRSNMGEYLFFLKNHGISVLFCCIAPFFSLFFYKMGVKNLYSGVIL